MSTLPAAPPESRATPTHRPHATAEGRSASLYPLAALCVGMLLVAALAAIVATQVSVWALDETLLKASAVHYGTGFPDSLFHDLTARASTRLYSLTLAPLFAVFDADVAVRIAKGWNALLFASAAVPSYLIARTVLASRWRAVGVGLLCVALPWLTLTTALFAESLAYPVSIWLSYAILRAVRDPSPVRDAAVLAWSGVAVVSRVQLIAIFGGYVALLLVLALIEARSGTDCGERLGMLLRRLRQTPFSLGVAAAGVLFVLILAATGTLQSRVDRVLGGYGEVQHRDALPTDVPLGAAVELITLGLGVGVVPAVLSLAWYPSALRDRINPSARALAWTALAVTVSVFAFTLAAQSGYLAHITEERYYIYVVPFLWVGAFAAIESPGLSSSALTWAGVLLATLYGVVTLPYAFTPELFLAPTGKSVVYLSERALEEVRSTIGLGGLSARDLLFVVTATAAVVLAVGWRRAPWARRWLLASAATVQIGLTAYAFLAIDGRVGQGLADRTIEPSAAVRGWLDRAAGGQEVTWLQTAQWEDPNATIFVLREASFWNDRLRRRAQVPQLVPPSEGSPVDTLPLSQHDIRPDGRFEPDLPDGLTLVWAGSPFLQIHGSQAADDQFDQPLFLAEPTRPARAQWLATGLRADGAVLRGTPVELEAWPGGGAAIARLELAAPPNGEGVISLQLGDRSSVVRLEEGMTRLVRIPACGRMVTGRARARSGTRQADGAVVGAVVKSVFLEPAGSACDRG